MNSQVEDVDTKFDKLKKLQSNNWIEDKPKLEIKKTKVNDGCVLLLRHVLRGFNESAICCISSKSSFRSGSIKPFCHSPALVAQW